ncbi:hypothetical protein [uncultured Pseudacidovorax sp.]|uniref:hypothetical protein n=1 Tax=uncultured Pseudacidovorax sp. TaxID=679313 RepID=UPI0025E3E369|nr:hypothetical protein [uncultured Pseudacidovorax sp.]
MTAQVSGARSRAPSAAKATPPDQSGGRGPLMPERKPLNAEQLRAVLQGIAGKADVLMKLLTAIEQGTSDEEDEGLMLLAASMLACTIGGLADDASGGECVGDYEHWEYGATFANLGAKDAT